MRIVVTGARGLLGLTLGVELSKEHTVLGLDKDIALEVSDSFRIVRVDLLSQRLELDHLLAEFEPEGIIHCAALANVDLCEQDQELAYQMNARMAETVALLAAAHEARMVQVSTDAVFDGQRGDYSEEDNPNPLSVYANTKLEGERLVSQAYPQAAITRVNLFGWSAAGNRSLAEFFYYNLKAGKQLKGFTDVYFAPILTNHIAWVFADILEKGLSGLYHLVSPRAMSKFEFGTAIAGRFGLDADLIEPVSVADFGLKAPRSPLLTLRTEKLAAALGKPLPDVHNGLDSFYQLFQEGYPDYLKQLTAGR